jgi:hypothetical protein
VIIVIKVFTIFNSAGSMVFIFSLIVFIFMESVPVDVEGFL